MSEFKVFGDAVHRRFADMAKTPLFVVASDRDVIWEAYLNAFPPGSNPIFRKRTEHDCSCCRHFVRDIGAVVAIQNGAISSVWDITGLPEPYQAVADTMASYVKSLPIVDAYLTPLAKHGTAVSHELKDGYTLTWHHFAVEVPREFVTVDHAEKRGKIRTNFNVLLRALIELKPEAVATVAELIRENAIYRGAEFKSAVEEFRRLQERFLSLTNYITRDLLVWEAALGPRLAHFRNSVIGSLVQDLSNGMEVEGAVRAYEAKVAPQNYRRPTALITKRMIDDAMKTIQELGLEPALERRHARLTDVSVNSVLFVDNAVAGQMKGGIAGLLMEEVKPAAFDPTKAEAISVEGFLKTVLPKTKGIGLYLDNSLLGNFVSMTAPVHEDAPPLFRWGNGFAWSYDGNVTDTIKAKVKRAGGQVENVSLRVSLAWSNTDDLDLHIVEPNGNHIFFGHKDNKLDVDMNVHNVVRDPVENIRWINRPRDGEYRVWVNNFRKREAVDVGFAVEIESEGQIQTLRFNKAVPNGHDQPVAVLTVKGSKLAAVKSAQGIVSGASGQDKWGLKTLGLVRVNSIVLSPNHWDGREAGNKHWFFILDEARNPEPTRGIYNEFLHPNLEKHRKVFEVLGEKTKCPVTDEQLSGVGFSSTRKDKVTVVAMGPSLNKPYTIVF